MLAALRSRAHSLSSSYIRQPWMVTQRSLFSSLTVDKHGKTEILKLEEVQKVLSEVRADDVKVIPVGDHCDLTDYMVFATGRSSWHVRNIAQALIYKAAITNDKKKIPVPIELGRNNWKEQIEKVCSSAMLYLSTGTCSVIKVGKASMEKDDIIENVVAAVNGIAEIVPKKWANVRAFHLKFSESLALPIYQKVPELGLKIGGIMVGNDKNGEEKALVLANKKDKERGEIGKKKGRIHEVKYMDSVGFGGMVGEDESGSEEVENGDVGSDEVIGKKRKKVVEEGEKVNNGVKALKEKKNKVLVKSKKSKILV